MTFLLALAALALIVYATIGVLCLAGWFIRRVCARLYYFWWPL